MLSSHIQVPLGQYFQKNSLISTPPNVQHRATQYLFRRDQSMANIPWLILTKLHILLGLTAQISLSVSARYLSYPVSKVPDLCSPSLSGLRFASSCSWSEISMNNLEWKCGQRGNLIVVVAILLQFQLQLFYNC